jgi:inorganic triphosphatase YgiF
VHRPVSLHSVYFDTPDGQLRKRGLALRLRRDRGRWRQTLKGPGQAVSGLHAREEFEWEVPAKALALELLAHTPQAKLFEKRSVREALAPVFVTAFRRRVIELGFADGTEAALCLDAGEIRAGKRVEPISEAEIELSKGDARALLAFAIDLAAAVSFRLCDTSKAGRAWRLALGEPPAPRHAAHIKLDAKASPEQALAHMISSCLSQVGANSEGVIAGRDPEFLHQLRVAVRRLRVALSLLRDARWRKAIEPQKRKLKRLSVVLGEARNRDVFAADILPPITQHFGRQRLASLTAFAMAQQRRHGTAACKAIASRSFATLCLKVALLIAELQATQHVPAAATPGVRKFAAHTLKRRQHKLRKTAPGGERPTAQALHALRIEAKKLRYTADFFASLYPAKKVHHYVEALAALQTVLGDVNDASVSQKLLAPAAPAGADTPAPALCVLAQGWIAASEARGRVAYAAAWKHFLDAKPFW